MAVNLFDFFSSINNGDFTAVDRMTDDDVKSLSSVVLLMWMHGAQQHTAEHVIMTDIWCNEPSLGLWRHPRLLLKLFIAANSGFGNTRYKFKKSITKEESAIIRLIARHYGYGYNEAKDAMRLLSEKDIENIKELYKE